MAGDSRQITFPDHCVSMALEQFSPPGHWECLNVCQGVKLLNGVFADHNHARRLPENLMLWRSACSQNRSVPARIAETTYACDASTNGIFLSFSCHMKSPHAGGRFCLSRGERLLEVASVLPFSLQVSTLQLVREIQHV